MTNMPRVFVRVLNKEFFFIFYLLDLGHLCQYADKYGSHELGVQVRTQE